MKTEKKIRKKRRQIGSTRGPKITSTTLSIIEKSFRNSPFFGAGMLVNLPFKGRCRGTFNNISR